MIRAIFNFLFGTNFDGIVNIGHKVDSTVAEPKILKPPFKISEYGTELIRKHEALRLDSYPDTGGVWTIGYGYTPGIKPGMTITKEKAEELLYTYLRKQDAELNVLLSGIKLVSQDQYDAIASFVYNIGTTEFKKSTFLKYLKEHKWKEAAEQLYWVDKEGKPRGWIYDNGVVIPGLINRRKLEKILFLRSI